MNSITLPRLRGLRRLLGHRIARAGQDCQPLEQETYLLLSVKYQLWLAADMRFYTGHANHAGHYARDSAERLTAGGAFLPVTQKEARELNDSQILIAGHGRLVDWQLAQRAGNGVPPII